MPFRIYLHDLQGETLASGNMAFQSKVIEYLISTSHGESINIYLLNDITKQELEQTTYLSIFVRVILFALNKENNEFSKQRENDTELLNFGGMT